MNYRRSKKQRYIVLFFFSFLNTRFNFFIGRSIHFVVPPIMAIQTFYLLWPSTTIMMMMMMVWNGTEKKEPLLIRILINVFCSDSQY